MSDGVCPSSLGEQDTLRWATICPVISISFLNGRLLKWMGCSLIISQLNKGIRRSFVRYYSFFFAIDVGKQSIGGEIIVGVFRAGNRPFCFNSPRKSLFFRRIVEPWISFAEDQIYRRNFPRNTPSYSIFSFQKGIQERPLQFNFFWVVKRKIVATHNCSKILELRSGFQVTLDISSKMQKNPPLISTRREMASLPNLQH
jgi:hypothetical protein